MIKDILAAIGLAVLCGMAHDLYIYLRYGKEIRATTPPGLKKRWAESWLSFWGRSLAYREGRLEGLRIASRQENGVTIPATPANLFAITMLQASVERGDERGRT